LRLLLSDACIKGEKVIQVNISYLDHNKKNVCALDFIELRQDTLLDAYSSDSNQIQLTDTEMQNLSDAICYKTLKSQYDLSWKGAVEAYESITMEECRGISTRYIADMLVCADIIQHGSSEESDSTFTEATTMFDEAMLEISQIKRKVTTTFGETREITTNINARIDGFATSFIMAPEVLIYFDTGRLMALESSISKEMPVAEGVFEGDGQPFMTKEIKHKQKERIKAVKQVTEEKKNPPPPKKPVKKARTAKKRPQTFKRIFKAKYIVLSESLRNKRIKKQNMSWVELITKFGATYVPNIGTFYNDTFLVCSKSDFDRKTVMLRDAINNKIPVVKEKFIFDCMQGNELLELESYLLVKYE